MYVCFVLPNPGTSLTLLDGGGVDTAALQTQHPAQPQAGKHPHILRGRTGSAMHERKGPFLISWFSPSATTPAQALPRTSPGPSSPSLAFLPRGQRPGSEGPPTPDVACCHCLSLFATPPPAASSPRPSLLPYRCLSPAPSPPAVCFQVSSAQLGASVSLPIHPASGEEEEEEEGEPAGRRSALTAAVNAGQCAEGPLRARGEALPSARGHARCRGAPQ